MGLALRAVEFLFSVSEGGTQAWFAVIRRTTWFTGSRGYARYLGEDTRGRAVMLLKQSQP